MFETLSDRLNGVFEKFSGQKTLNEENVQAGLREVRLALLEVRRFFRFWRWPSIQEPGAQGG
jgi:SRP54 family protein